MSPKKVAKQPEAKSADPIAAFIITAFGKPNATAEENLRQMVGKFATCQKEFFLFIRREQDSFRRDFVLGSVGLMPPHDYSYIKTTLCLGIIEGELRFGDAGTPFKFPIRSPHAVGGLIGNSKPWGRNVFEPEIFYSYEILMSLKENKKNLQTSIFRDLTWR